MEPMLSPLAINPFTLMSDAWRKIAFRGDSEFPPFDAREDFWDQECDLHPNMIHCKVYEE